MLEVQFDLMYHLEMSITDYDRNDIKDNAWMHARLIQQKNEEIKAQKDAMKKSQGSIRQ